MQEIEIGEYVRTEKGIIDKTVINYYGICNSKNCNCKHVSCQKDYYDEEDIVKHSKNLIDLIEVGDIIEIYFPIKQKKRKIFVDEYFKDSMVLDGIIQKRIILKSIATKEQIAGIEYKI